MNKLTQWISLSRSMGMRYVSFRAWHEVKRKTRVLRRSFPVDPPFHEWISLDRWRQSAPQFFFESRNELDGVIPRSPVLQAEATRILNHEIRFFHGEWKAIEKDDWVTHPVTGIVYDTTRHWTDIPDFHPAYGDIKYVWEKSRFTFLQTILRYDAAYGADSSQWVFAQIESWIHHNPVNRGPNYRCSQETALRLFNWILALYFYRHSPALNEKLFSKILFHIYWQARHVRDNIHFSRIAVRNNHAITETLALYTFGLLFPFFGEAAEWKKTGRKWFEEEIAYQVYPDGTYLQFSSNYHRVVVQLLTWAISLADAHGEEFGGTVYSRAHASLNLLLHCQDKVSGQLPNYGANDGSLFFNWNDTGYHDYRPALEALHVALISEKLYPETSFQDVHWFGIKSGRTHQPPVVVTDGIFSFPHGGIYVYRRDTLLVVINCVSYKDRPQQADNLHIDVWYDGQNVLWDAGSYQYNTSPEHVKFFFGTESHNSVMLDNQDQMLKGSRFIWLGWSKALYAGWKTEGEQSIFEGSAKVFSHLGDITHTRRVAINRNTITVTDKVQGADQRKLRQLWHINPAAAEKVDITSSHAGEPLRADRMQRHYSPTYGVLEPSEQLEFSPSGDSITTEIQLT